MASVRAPAEEAVSCPSRHLRFRNDPAVGGQQQQTYLAVMSLNMRSVVNSDTPCPMLPRHHPAQCTIARRARRARNRSIEQSGSRRVGTEKIPLIRPEHVDQVGEGCQPWDIAAVSISPHPRDLPSADTETSDDVALGRDAYGKQLRPDSADSSSPLKWFRAWPLAPSSRLCGKRIRGVSWLWLRRSPCDEP
jgi:hypothetical protein